ncbi:zinc finger MYM-type protein 1-like, partial [Nilaparvata lugens]|uniref:zinc finger MYM-type protein 1-like n=1 Tax=Nilaparvata lugens TaxID=108931 RepID=UPI00193E0936
MPHLQCVNAGLSMLSMRFLFINIVDEARDVSTKEKMSVWVRYTNKTKLLERFLGFVELTELSAKSLFSEISQFLENSGLNIKRFVGQAYDGASVMSGHLTGVNVLVREVAENPCVYVHCYAHRLNLILVDMAKNVKLVDDMLGLLEEIYAFQSASTLRHQKFRDAQEREDPKKRIFEMPQQSDTRWVSKYKGVMYFENNFLAVLSVLDSFTTSSNKMEAASAKGFLMQLKEFDVIFAHHFLGDMNEDVQLPCANAELLVEHEEKNSMTSAEKLLFSMDLSQILDHEEEIADFFVHAQPNTSQDIVINNQDGQLDKSEQQTSTPLVTAMEEKTIASSESDCDNSDEDTNYEGNSDSSSISNDSNT